MEDLPVRFVPLRGEAMRILHDHISHADDEKAVEAAKEYLRDRGLLNKEQDGVFTHPVIENHLRGHCVIVKALCNGEAVKVSFILQEAPEEIELERHVLEIAGEFLFTMRPGACVQTLVEGMRRVGRKISEPKDYYGLKMRPVPTPGEEDVMFTADICMDGVEYHFKPGGVGIVMKKKHRRHKKKKRAPSAFMSRVTRKRGR